MGPAYALHGNWHARTKVDVCGAPLRTGVPNSNASAPEYPKRVCGLVFQSLPRAFKRGVDSALLCKLRPLGCLTGISFPLCFSLLFLFLLLF